MLYAMQLSFYEREDDRYGSFIYFVEAGDSDSAVEKLRKYLKEGIKSSAHMLYGEIFLGGIVEIAELPPKGTILFYKSASGEPEPCPFDSTIECDCLPEDGGRMESLFWYPDGQERTPEQEETIYSASPFIILPKPSKKKGKKT